MSVLLSQVQDEVATARAIHPVQDRDFGVSVFIVNCPSSKLDIGFTWDCAETSQEMKLVLASSSQRHSPDSSIFDLLELDVIHITRCPHAQDEYNIGQYNIRSGLLKNNHNVSVGKNTKPILMVRMFDRDTRIQVFEQNKKQQNQFMQDYKSHLFALAKTVGK
eukprot:scpid101677/ scgid23232/ 